MDGGVRSDDPSFRLPLIVVADASDYITLNFVALAVTSVVLALLCRRSYMEMLNKRPAHSPSEDELESLFVYTAASEPLPAIQKGAKYNGLHLI